MNSPKTRQLWLGWCVAFVLAFAWMVVPGKAIPPAQAQCAFDLQSTVSDNGQTAIPGLSVSLTPSQDGPALVKFTADVGVDDQAELRLAYSVDGAPANEYQYGPGNFSNHQQFWEGHTTMAVIPLSGGTTHTITPYWRVSGAPGMSAFMVTRCISAESETQ